MRALKGRSGFTFFELIICMVITAILAGIAVPFYMGYVQQGKKAEALAVMNTAVAGGKIYFLKNRTYENSTFALWLAQDDVDHSDNFTYALSSVSGTGFKIVATEEGDWAPNGATITWEMSGAAAAQRDPGSGAFEESGW